MSNFFEKKKFLDLNSNRRHYTVVVQKINGQLSEHQNITDPWKYIAKCKRSPGVKNAWIKK